MKIQACLLTLAFLAAISSFATESYQIKGMHCGGCVEMVKAKVCSLPQVTNCNAELVKGKKNTGKVTYDLKEGQTLDQATLASTIKEVGDDYELVTPKPAKKAAKKKAN